MSEGRQFTYAGSRSGGLLAGIILVLVSEGVGIHLWLYGRKPWLAWMLTLATLSAIVWLVMDYRSLGTGAIDIDRETIHLKVGRRYDLRIPLRSVATASVPSWRELPEPGTPAAGDYVNLMKQAAPNVLLTLESPTTIRVPPGRNRQIQRIAMHLDDPEAFISAVRLLQS